MTRWLTDEEIEEWSRPPYACPNCLSPFLRWSACLAHLSLTSKSCHRLLDEGYSTIQSQCQQVAANKAGSFKAPPPYQVYAPRKFKDSFRASGKFKVSKETPAEIQSIQDDIERAVFGHKRFNQPNGASEEMCHMCSMSEANCYFSPCGHAVGACHSCTVVLSPLNCACGVTISGFFKN